MTNAVSICSNALMLLGDKAIATFNDANNTTGARLCANIYPNARLDVMRLHYWNCLETMVVLSPVDTAPAFDWGYKFDLPADCLRVINVGTKSGNQDYRLQGKQLLANTNAAYLTYVGDKAEELWDSHLSDLMIKRMAADLAYPVTKSTSLAEARDALYRAAIRNAKAVDAQENPPDELTGSAFIAARG